MISELTVTRVVVGRGKMETAVSHCVVHEGGGIYVKMSVEDFLNHLSDEVGGTMLPLTKAVLAKRIKDAANRVITEMRLSSTAKPLPLERIHAPDQIQE